MVVNKRKKNSRQRGSWTHGGGAKKKRRGSGHQGGKGMAGSGKRADTKKPSTLWADKDYFGKFGFKSKNVRKIKATNINYIEQKFDTLLEQKLIKKEGDSYAINLRDLGFNKLLADGTPSRKYKITAEFSSANAVEKIKEAGGDVSVGSNDEKEENAPAKEAE